VALGTDKS